MKTNLTEEEKLKLQEKLGKKSSSMKPWSRWFMTSASKPLNLIIVRKQSRSETHITNEKRDSRDACPD